jgi:ArsR family transcriptional regulator, cadmium/lead-responsive transcriptional repressor
MAADAVFAALADPTRRRMIEILAGRPTETATGFAAELPITRQAVAKHLATLRRARLVRAARSGRETRYSLDGEPLAGVSGWVALVGAEWDARLERLERTLSTRA